MTKTLDEDLPVFELTENGEFGEYELIYELRPNKDRAGREYEMVTQSLENEDFYQGLNMLTVIRRISDGKLFGYPWWDDISKHGESYIQPNGEEFGLETDVSADDFDWENDFISFYVFEPVEEKTRVYYSIVSND